MSPENEAFLRRLVEEGRFPTSEAAIDAVVASVRREHDDKLAHLQALLREGLNDLDAGRVAPLDLQDLKRRGRERLESRRKRAEAG